MKYLIFCFFGAVIMPITVQAEELVQDKQVFEKARVLEVVAQEMRTVDGTDVSTTYQKLRVEILEGNDKGKVVTIDNDYLNLSENEKFYLIHTINSLDGTERYSVGEPYRLPALFALSALFIVVVAFFGGLQGIRGLLSLSASFFFILFLLLPGIIQGWPPALAAIGIASLIVLIGSYVTHGFTKTTTAAVLGMIVTILMTGALAYVAIQTTHLSGFGSEDTTYLNLNTRGTIDFAGLLFGGILIGLLGAMYDAAIGQSVAVEELSSAGPQLSRREIYGRALRIGREHIGALVNMLAIAYVGASLPLLLLFYTASDASIWVTLNRELFSEEIVRVIVGSIGVVLVVPVTTLVSVYLLMGNAVERA